MFCVFRFGNFRATRNIFSVFQNGATRTLILCDKTSIMLHAMFEGDSMFPWYVMEKTFCFNKTFKNSEKHWMIS